LGVISFTGAALLVYGPGIDSQWCHWGFFPWLPPTEPCALRTTQPLKVSTRDFSWGKGGRWFWLTTYHPCSAETSRKSGALVYLEPLGPPRPLAGDLYFTLLTRFTKLTRGFSVDRVSKWKWLWCG